MVEKILAIRIARSKAAQQTDGYDKFVPCEASGPQSSKAGFFLRDFIRLPEKSSDLYVRKLLCLINFNNCPKEVEYQGITARYQSQTENHDFLVTVVAADSHQDLFQADTSCLNGLEKKTKW